MEFIPGTHQYLLTVMSVWWAFGQIRSYSPHPSVDEDENLISGNSCQRCCLAATGELFVSRARRVYEVGQYGMAIFHIHVRPILPSRTGAVYGSHGVLTWAL